MRIAALTGCERHIEKLMIGRPDFHGATLENGWNLDVEGAAGEMAFAKWRNNYWSGNMGNLKADDVGRYQVRTAGSHHFCLIIHEKDPNDRAFILVTGLAPHFVIRGWMWGRDAKQHIYWSDPAGGRPAYFIPQKDLRPMPELKPEQKLHHHEPSLP